MIIKSLHTLNRYRIKKPVALSVTAIYFNTDNHGKIKSGDTIPEYKALTLEKLYGMFGSNVLIKISIADKPEAGELDINLDDFTVNVFGEIRI